MISTLVKNDQALNMQKNERLEAAQKLMYDFVQRTGLHGKEGDINDRYLWTDAFAVQTFFNLAHLHVDELFRNLALKLIEQVHQTLGKFHPDDERKGWISGLPEQEGEKHPTIRGLRIGKKLPERKPGERFDERLEWERDGQYFHYLTRWIYALLQASEETSDEHYVIWAAELLKAGAKFIDKSRARIRMFWKMSTDLSRPLISSIGAHDPLDGLICALSIFEKVRANRSEIESVVDDLKNCRKGIDWSSSDALSTGGLLLNLARLVQMDLSKYELPENVKSQRLLNDALNGLKWFTENFEPEQSALQRLAFRECGLSLGIHVITGMKQKPGLNLNFFDDYCSIAEEIETFWMNPQNQGSPTWTEHRNINAVTLAASLIAQ